jgi:hypothetical protein
MFDWRKTTYTEKLSNSVPALGIGRVDVARQGSQRRQRNVWAPSSHELLEFTVLDDNKRTVALCDPANKVRTTEHGYWDCDTAEQSIRTEPQGLCGRDGNR